MTTTSRLPLVAAALGLALALALSACAGASPGPRAAVAGHCGAPSMGLKAFPDGTVEDWVTYGDFLVLLTVRSEDEPAPQASDVPGRMEWRTDRVVWSRPSRNPGIAMPETFTVGWERGFEVGQTCLAVVLYADLGETGEPELIILRTLPVVDSAVQAPPDDRSFEAVEVVGRSVDEVGRILAETEVDPFAKPYLHLDPWQRRKRVMLDNPGPPATPGPGER
ncbi:hypothetical protein [Microlunatus sp. GCM10028923]|uniref:hypothetical protein n=1 Tax=Microlunatus sp. GCM10028923 TaxID=3273400 RepID=UPI0036107677